MKNSRQKGITLVALVITVIVLLILAGAAVTIALNGDSIFSKANRSVTDWNARVTEENEATNELYDLLDSIGKATTPTGITKVGYTSSSITVKATGGISYKYKISTDADWRTAEPIADGTSYEITGLTNGETYTVVAININEKGEESNPITKTMKVGYDGRIGQYVHYAVDLGIGKKVGDAIENSTDTVTAAQAVDDDWVVFYEDEANGYTYLIAADYVPVANSYLAGAQGALAKAGLSSANTYAVYASSISNATTMDTLASTRYKLTWNGTINKLKHNATVALLNTTAWSGLALTNVNANITAVGGPTVDLWVASWIQRGYSPLYLATNVADEGTDGTNAKNYGSGYYVGTAATPTTTYQRVVYNATSFPLTGYNSAAPSQSNPSVNNKVYFPRTTATSDNCYGYWLAAASACGFSTSAFNNVMLVNYGGLVSITNFSGTSYGVRPVVSLPSNIIGAVGSTSGIYYVDGTVND